jgi:hypothetical protein
MGSAMMKKPGRPKIADTGALLVPSSAVLENHFEELLEANEEIQGLTALLKSLPPADEKREEYEGRLNAALTLSITVSDRPSRNGIAWWIG